MLESVQNMLLYPFHTTCGITHGYRHQTKCPVLQLLSNVPMQTCGIVAHLPIPLASNESLGSAQNFHL